MRYHDFEGLQLQFPSLSWQNIQRIVRNRPAEQWENDCTSILSGTPWEYIIGKADFGPLELFIEPPLLVPRDETWEWVEKAAQYFRGTTLCDLGCGLGTIGLGFNVFHPRAFDLIAIDIHPIAIRIATQNFQASSLRQWQCFTSHWFDAIPPQRFDCIVANPPYCNAEQPLFSEHSPEDRNARFAAHGGLLPYVEIFSKAIQYLHPKGQLIVEHGADQGATLAHLAPFYQLEYVQSFCDHSGAWRATEFHVLSKKRLI